MKALEVLNRRNLEWNNIRPLLILAIIVFMDMSNDNLESDVKMFLPLLTKSLLKSSCESVYLLVCLLE